MSISTGQTPQIACVPGAIPAANRAAHFTLAKHLLTEAAEQRDALPNGYAFRFADDAFESIAKFVSNERQCCPFIRFEIVIDANPKGVWLRMTGPDGTRELIDAEFGFTACQVIACDCGASAP